jgi:hypothetical protein
MKHAEIIRMALEAGLPLIHGRFLTEHQEKFAELLVAAERAACMACYSPDNSAIDWMDAMEARGEP